MWTHILGYLITLGNNMKEFVRKRYIELIFVAMLCIVLTLIFIFVRDTHGICTVGKLYQLDSRFAELDNIKFSSHVKWTKTFLPRGKSVYVFQSYINRNDLDVFEEFKTGPHEHKVDVCNFTKDRIGEKYLLYTIRSSVHRLLYKIYYFEDGYIVIDTYFL